MSRSDDAIEQAAVELEEYLWIKRLEREARRAEQDRRYARYQDQLAKHVQHPPGSAVHAHGLGGSR